MAESVHIRPAVERDVAGMTRIVVDTARAAFRSLVPECAGWLTNSRPLDDLYAESEQNWRRAFGEIAAAPVCREQIFVATDAAAGGSVVGLANGGPCRLPAPPFDSDAGEAHIRLVLPSYRRRGIDRQLMQAVFHHLLEVDLPSHLATRNVRLADRGEFELWDTESANCLGSYKSMADALRAVAQEVEEFGEGGPEIRSLALVRLDAPPGKGRVAAGEALAALALQRLRGGLYADGA